ncbi:hypothetical protein NDU88_005607 [Pleurodeles waltl]|uniref:Uncharacterized protein n=1 Tax=Pleurodeles waltl TaxID=8319 RepID=A0AAV7WD69_PLEWA|nr:hypothetical protein NDU88_005607 [Pleurodeles waltl]
MGVTMLTQEDGSEVKNHDLIATQLRDFYRDLYSTQSTPRSAINRFLWTANVSQLTLTQADEIDKPIHTEEVIAAIACLELHKSPEPDGFLASFCRPVVMHWHPY